ncbi:MAG TPA: hypothetical protein VLK29_05045, partial [Luteimonas sp.]|nr:hypothetical protein [Luteimonas sp.]
CSWFRKGNALYAQSPESRPLEVPPDLDRPDTSGAMQMPAASGSASAPRQASAPASSAAASATASPTGFTVAGERDVVFDRVGGVLSSTAGVTVVSKAQILGTYDIDYEGSKFLVRVSTGNGGTYVSAVDPRGLPAAGDGAVKLMASLRSALGG